MGGDTNGDYKPWNFVAGNYTLKTTTYSGAGATGTAGPSATIQFRIAEGLTPTPTPRPSPTPSPVSQFSTKASFTFILSQSARTSAGVYLSDGTLIKTLWNNVSYKAGTFNESWDGTDDDGRRVPGGNYHVKVVSNNVNYTWEGVIGNTSTSFTGPRVLRSYHRAYALAISGDTVYLGNRYSEGSGAQLKFHTSKPQDHYRVMGDGHSTDQETIAIATDDNYVYWGGVDPFKDENSFIFASRVSDDSEVVFQSGSPLKMTYGRTYQSVINPVQSLNSWITGLAVQKNGNYLFATRKSLNTLSVVHKTTGAVLWTYNYASPQYVAVDAKGYLWLHYLKDGVPAIQKFSVNAQTGAITPLSTRLAQVVSPQALAMSRDGSTLVLADGGSSQQLKGYNTLDTSASLSPLWTYGQVGGYARDATVSDDKFYFDDPSGLTSQSGIAFQTDGSMWVIDGGNYRIQRLSPSLQFLDRIMYIQHFYSMAVDRNSPTRVFADYLEFSVDYSKVLAPNNGSWVLKKNWGYNIPSTYDDQFFRLSYVNTLSNGRTYALQRNGQNWHVVELVEGGAIRLTGIQFSRAATQLYPDGSLRNVSTTDVGKPVQFTRRPLLNFDNNNNPVWGPATTLASAPTKTMQDPLYWGKFMSLTAGEVTSSGLLISYDGGLPPRGSEGYHLGAIKLGDSKWLWKTAKSTHESYQGVYPTDGSYDIGNNAQYGGTVGMALDRSIFWGYHGEFWKNGQTNKWNHVYDNGLMLGQFGTTKWDFGSEEKPAGMAGNAFSAALVKQGSNYYLYHCDENYHGGVHRWKVSNLGSIQEQSIPISIGNAKPGLLGVYFDGTHLNNFSIKTSRLDTAVNLNANPSGTSLSNLSQYSVRWSGYVKPLYSQAYTFYVNTDEKVRLWIDGELVIDQWNGNVSREYASSPVSLVAGQAYSIRLDYANSSGTGKAVLAWSSASQAKGVVSSSQLLSAIPLDRTNGVDLLEGVPIRTVLQGNAYGWSRTPVIEDLTNIQKQYWSTKTGVKTHDKFKSTDIYMRFRQSTGTASVVRDLGTQSGLSSWKLAGVVSMDGHYPNTTGGGMYFEVLDSVGKIITRFYSDISYKTPWYTYIYANSRLITEGEDSFLKEIYKKPQDLEISATSNGILTRYGPFESVTTGLYDSSANWKNPKTVRVYFFGNGFNYDRIFDIEAMKFIKN